MITLVIVAILLGVAVPAFQATLDKRRLTGIVEQFYADLQYARSEAIQRNANVHLTFTGTGTDWCYGIATKVCNCTTTDDCQLNGEKVIKGSDFKDVSLTPPTGNTLSFEPRGIATSNRKAKFTLARVGAVEVIVSKVGRVRFCSDDVPEYKPDSGTC